MKRKFELDALAVERGYNELPFDVQYIVAGFFSNRILASYAQVSKVHSELLQPLLNKRKLAYTAYTKSIGLDTFLLHVVQGEHEAVNAILLKNIRLICIRGNVTDCSQRTFKNISAFEYSLWALDKHMWVIMLLCIPPHEGIEITKQLITQYNKVKTTGVTYTLHGKAITENHFDFANTIIKELQTLTDLIKSQGIQNWHAINKKGREGVGGAETLLPMHVVYEYCGETLFKLPKSKLTGHRPKPKFTSQPKSSRMFFNNLTRKQEDWFAENSELGINFAIYKSEKGQAYGMANHPMFTTPRNTLVALTALFQERTTDFANLKSQLKEKATVDDKPHSYKLRGCITS